MIDTSAFETNVFIDQWDENRNPMHVIFQNHQGETVGDHKYRAKKKKSVKLTNLAEVSQTENY